MGRLTADRSRPLDPVGGAPHAGRGKVTEQRCPVSRPRPFRGTCAVGFSPGTPLANALGNGAFCERGRPARTGAKLAGRWRGSPWAGASHPRGRGKRPEEPEENAGGTPASEGRAVPRTQFPPKQLRGVKSEPPTGWPRCAPMCRALGVSPSGSHAWRGGGRSGARSERRPPPMSGPPRTGPGDGRIPGRRRRRPPDRAAVWNGPTPCERG